MLHYKADILVRKDVPRKEEKYSQEEIEAITRNLSLPMTFDVYETPGTSYRADWKVEFIGPERQLNDIKIPLADLRAKIVDFMKDGITEVPLEDFLLLCRDIYQKTEAS